MDEISNDDVAFCPLNYDPVCGRKDTGIRCVTTPCESSEDITYSNACALGVDKAKFLYEGVCKIEAEEAPVNCKSWFDGCNQCFRGSEGGPLACTKMACSENLPAMCNQYFEEIIPPVAPSVDVADPKIEYLDFEYPETIIPNTSGFWKQFVDFITKILNFNF